MNPAQAFRRGPTNGSCSAGPIEDNAIVIRLTTLRVQGMLQMHCRVPAYVSAGARAANADRV
jgi:hypothetical protein